MEDSRINLFNQVVLSLLNQGYGITEALESASLALTSFDKHFLVPNKKLV